MKKGSYAHHIFLERLELFMRIAQKSQEDLAKAAGVTPQAVSGHMKSSFPKANVLAEWAKHLDLNVNWLLTGEGEVLRHTQIAPSSGMQTETERLKDKIIALHEELNGVRKELDMLRVAAAQENFEEGPASGKANAVLSWHQKTEG